MPSDSRYYDDKYLNDRLNKLENITSSSSNLAYKSQEQTENEQLKRENEMLKQRLQMAADPVRAEFEQSDEFRNAWMTNIVSYLYEVNMAQWAQSPYAKKLDEWTSSRIEEIRESHTPKQATQPSAKSKVTQQASNNQKENNDA